MDVSALHGKRLGAAVIFVAAILVLAVQLITPSPVMVSVGENGTQTTQLGQYFTHTDVGIIAVTASLLGASGTYLLLHDPIAPGTMTESKPRQATVNRGVEPSTGQKPTQPVGGGDRSSGAVLQYQELDQQDKWEETVDRLRSHEKTVYAVVLEASGELPQRDIVEGTDLSKATVSRTLDTLESKGLVERKRKGMGNLVVLQ